MITESTEQGAQVGEPLEVITKTALSIARTWERRWPRYAGELASAANFAVAKCLDRHPELEGLDQRKYMLHTVVCAMRQTLRDERQRLDMERLDGELASVPVHTWDETIFDEILEIACDTPTDLQIIELLLDGARIKDVAREFGLSVGCICKYIGKMRTRLEAAGWVQRKPTTGSVTCRTCGVDKAATEFYSNCGIIQTKMCKVCRREDIYKRRAAKVD